MAAVAASDHQRTAAAYNSLIMTDEPDAPDALPDPAQQLSPQQLLAAQSAALGLLAHALHTGGNVSAADVNYILADVLTDGVGTVHDVVVLLSAMVGVTTALLEHLSPDPLALIRHLALKAAEQQAAQ